MVGSIVLCMCSRYWMAEVGAICTLRSNQHSRVVRLLEIVGQLAPSNKAGSLRSPLRKVVVSFTFQRFPAVPPYLRFAPLARLQDSVPELARLSEQPAPSVPA